MWYTLRQKRMLRLRSHDSLQTHQRLDALLRQRSLSIARRDLVPSGAARILVS